MDVCNTGDCNDRSDGCLLYLYLLETVKLIKLCYADSLGLGIIVMVDDDNILVHMDGAVIDLTDSDTSDIFIVINCADQYLCAGIRIALRSRNIIEDRIKQRHHVLARLVCTVGSDTFLCGCINKWAVELLLVGIQINEKLQDFINNLLRTRLRTVDLVDADDNRKLQFQCLLQYELRLRHCSLEGVNHKNNTVYHFKDTFYLATEIGVARCVDNVDLCIFISDSGILG